MRVNSKIRCRTFPCEDVNHRRFTVPAIDIDLGSIFVVMISEAAPADPRDYFYARGEPLFQLTTVQAFRDAGARVSTMKDILGLGVYVTTAVKCGKKAYAIDRLTVDRCSELLEREIDLFPNLKVLLLMGDVAIRAVNSIAKRLGEARVIPAGSTYKIRGGRFHLRGVRAIPSYLQAGPSYLLEASKRRMISEDIRTALDVL